MLMARNFCSIHATLGREAHLMTVTRLTEREQQNARRFVTLDLRAFANAGPCRGPDEEWRWTPDGPAVRQWPSGQPVSLEGFPVGDCFFHGIPFALIDPATNRDRCWLALSNQSATLLSQVTIPLSKPQMAASVLVAHCTDFEHSDAKIGEVLATYTLILEDGERVDVPVRRRFEIAGRQGTIGTQGYAILPHTQYQPVRTPAADSEGLYGLASQGSRQTYWLMVLENPSPYKAVRAIELTACHADLVIVGAITLAPYAENPLRRGPRAGIVVDLAALADVEAAPVSAQDYPPDLEIVPVNDARPDDLALAVDLGTIPHCSALSPQSAEQWLAAPIKGWGAAVSSEAVSVIYAQVAAAQDAHLLLRRGGALSVFRWQDILAGKSPVKVAAEEWVRVSVRVVDGRDGKELASRVHFHGTHGEYLPPLGHTAVVNNAWGQNVGGDLRLGSMSYAYVPGHFEIMLPVGEVGVEIVHGFEYTPLRTTLMVQAAQPEIVLKLERWSDIRQRGYYCGDVHVHFLDPITATLETEAEDLNVANLQAVQWGRGYTNVEHGIGHEHDTGAPDRMVRMDSENRHHIMGHVFLLNLTEPILPMSSGGPTEDEIGGWEEVSLVDWCAACKQQGGQVFTQFTPTPHAEVTAAIALGLIDAVEVRWFDFAPHLHIEGHWGETPFAFPGVLQWYAYLNAGYRLPAVGGTDKMSNAMALGALRTYTDLGAGQPFDYAAWCAAIAHGRTFVSTGPLLELSVDDQMPGDEIHLPISGGQVHVKAVANSVQPFEVIDLVVNGQVVARAEANASGRAASLEATVTVNQSSWIAARCYGRGKLHTHYATDIGAHSSPVYVTVGNQRQTSTVDAHYLLTLLHGGIAYLEKLAVWRSEQQRQHHFEVLERARQAILRHHPHARPHWESLRDGSVVIAHSKHSHPHPPEE